MANGKVVTKEEWLRSILKVLRDGLVPFVLEEFKEKYPDRYLDELRQSLSANGSRYVADFENENDFIQKADSQACMAIIRDNHPYMFRKLDSATIEYVKELIKYRNDLAHERPVGDPVPYRAAAIAALVLHKAGNMELYEEASRLAARIQQGNGHDVEESEPQQNEVQPEVKITLNREMNEDFDSEGTTAPIHLYWMEVRYKDGRTEKMLLPLSAAKRRVILGRSGVTSDVALEDMQVSRVHAQVILNGDGSLSVADLHSGNGTYLDGLRLTANMPATWNPEKALVIGCTELRLTDAG
ncbi:MAG: FHA domain-containing protein [Anaerolineae bacterium]|nr:FHA domain-containing protein [Anaerolineae bacterium]